MRFTTTCNRQYDAVQVRSNTYTQQRWPKCLPSQNHRLLVQKQPKHRTLEGLRWPRNVEKVLRYETVKPRRRHSLSGRMEPQGKVYRMVANKRKRDRGSNKIDSEFSDNSETESVSQPDEVLIAGPCDLLDEAPTLPQELLQTVIKPVGELLVSGCVNWEL
ncbi:hypothetical protein FQA39_LY01283 [Lamprigera yunnana]|nr:hypothetical protein FQA39_LY01283 [Lamprigera yunnana]